MDTPEQTVDHACAWTGAQMRRTSEWIVQWPAGAREELAAAAARVGRLGKKAPHFDKRDFPLATLAPFLEKVAQEVTRGRGFVLLRGLSVTASPGERETFQDI